MARSEDVTVHVPAEVIAEIRQEVSREERREIENTSYSLNRRFESELILRYALREFARQQGHTVREDTEVAPLPSGEIEVTQNEDSGSSLNPLR